MKPELPVQPNVLPPEPIKPNHKPKPELTIYKAEATKVVWSEPVKPEQTARADVRNRSAELSPVNESIESEI